MLRICRTFILSTFSFVLLNLSQVYAAPLVDTLSSTIELTHEEQQWIESIDSIRVPALRDISPYSYIEDDEIKGYSIDYLELLSQKSGLPFTFVKEKTWGEYVYMMEDGQLDMLHLVRKNNYISQYMDFSDAYLSVPSPTFYGKASSHYVSSLDDLASAKIAVQRNVSHQRSISRDYPDLELVLVDSTGDGLFSVLRGEADYFLCTPTVCNTYIYKNFITNLVPRGAGQLSRVENQPVYLTTSKKMPHLKSIVAKAMNAITPEEEDALRTKWLKYVRDNVAERTQLTEKEKLWLQNNREIYFSAPLKAPPFNFLNEEGEFVGISKDIIDRFEQQYGVVVHLEKYGSWREAYGALIDGKVDFIPSITVTDERKSDILYSDATMSHQQSYFTRYDHPIIRDLDSLQNKTIAMVEGAALTQQIERDFPFLRVVRYNTMQDTVKAVGRGDVDLVAGNRYVIDYHASLMGIDNIEFRGDLPYTYDLAFGFNKQNPELSSLFNRLLADIDEDEVDLMFSKWNNLKVVNHVDWSGSVTLSLIGTSVALLIALALFSRSSKIAQQKLSKTRLRLENAQRVTGSGNWDITSNRSYVDLSLEASNIVEIANGNSITRSSYLQLIHPQDRPLYLTGWEKALRTGLLNIEYRLVLESGTKWVQEIAELKMDESGELLSGLGTIQNISIFKEGERRLIQQQLDLQLLTNRLLTVQEEERKRVARELHDDLSQRLAVVSLNLGVFTSSNSGENSQLLKETKQDLVRIAEDTHSLSRRLHPSILEDLGLVDALKSEIYSFEKREEIQVNFLATKKPITLTNDKALVLFRITQEALRNISKYSEASYVEISLSKIDDIVILQISDDGMGFNIEEAMRSPGLGLTSMRERARLIDAKFSINSEENKGTHIEIQVTESTEADVTS